MGVWIEMAGMRVGAALLRLPLSWRGAGTLVVGMLLARWTWVLFAPHTLAALPAKSESTQASAALFGVTALSDTSVSNEGGDASVPRLAGVFSGKHGFAILRLDDRRQVGVVLGEEVSQGTRLVEVAADYVLLERNGMRQRVNLENKFAGHADRKAETNTLPAAPVAAVIGSTATDPEKLAQEIKKKMLEAANSMDKEEP